MPNAEKLLTPQEAAELLGLQEGTLAVWRSTQRYALPFVKCGRLVRYKASDVRRFIEENTHVAAAPPEFAGAGR